MSNWNATIRNDRKKFVADVQEFFKEATQAIEICSQTTLTQIAPQFMQAVINSAGFDDYSGVLANSYIMAMVVNGKVAPNFHGQKRNSWKERFITIQKGKQGTINRVNSWNSYDMHNRGMVRGLANIKRAKEISELWKNSKGKIDKRQRIGTIGRKRVILQNRFPRNNHQKYISIKKEVYEKLFEERGYGYRISSIRGMSIGTGRGSGLVITNAAPYAAQIHNNGSVVIPMAVGSMVQNSMVAVMKNEFNKIKMVKR